MGNFSLSKIRGQMALDKEVIRPVKHLGKSTLHVLREQDWKQKASIAIIQLTDNGVSWTRMLVMESMKSGETLKIFQK